jgi:hypothetical protein
MWLTPFTVWQFSLPGKAETRKPHRSTGVRCMSENRPWDLSTPIWPIRSVDWLIFSCSKGNTNGPKHFIGAPCVFENNILVYIILKQRKRCMIWQSCGRSRANCMSRSPSLNARCTSAHYPWEMLTPKRSPREHSLLNLPRNRRAFRQKRLLN